MKEKLLVITEDSS